MGTIMSEPLLALDGRALARILIADNADRVTRFAAQELVRYLSRITGARFRVRPEPRGSRPLPEAPCILIGEGPWRKLTGFPADPCSDPFDGFTLKTSGGRIFIRGHNGRSNLYGVYTFLERLGCRFIEPGADGEYVPKREDLTVPRLRKTEVAAFPLRNIFRNIVHVTPAPLRGFMDPAIHLPQIDWMAKQRLNRYEFYVDYYRFDLWEKHKKPFLAALADRGFDLELTHHSLHYFSPPDENHDFGGYGPATYRHNHPGWYVPSKECGGRGRWQTRVEIPAVRKVVTERFVDYVVRNPELKTVSIWPDDVPMNKPYRGLTWTDGYMKFWNRIAKELHRAAPDKQLAVIAYFELIRPPRRIKPASNLHCWFCPISMDYNLPVTHRRNREFLKHLAGWTRAMPPHAVANFEYYGWQAPLLPHRCNIKTNLAAYRDAGLGGIYGWSGFTTNILGEDSRHALDLFALARLLWKPEFSIASLEETWARHVFGSAADEVLLFVRYVTMTHRKAVRDRGADNWRLWISLPNLHHMQKLLGQARRKAGHTRQTERIDLLEKLAAHSCTERTWKPARRTMPCGT